MNSKSTILLLIVTLGVLGAIYYQKQQKQEIISSAAIPKKSLPSVTTGTVERITIDAPDQEVVTLTNAENTWYTNVEEQYEADENAVNAALKAIGEPIEATVVSTNPDSFDEYQVSDTSGTQVIIYEAGKAKPVVSMVVGKDGPSAFTTYIRMADAEEVLNAKANLSMAFKRPEGWRDKQIFSFNGSNATRIEEAGTSATFTVVRSADDKWNFAGDPTTGEAEPARVNSLANMFASLRANEFINPAQSQTLADFGLEPARQSVALTYEDKSTSPSKLTSVTLLIGNESNTPGDWYAKRANKNDIFTIGSHVAESLTPDPESIKVATPEPEPESVGEVTTATMTTMEASETTGTPSITNTETVNTTGTAQSNTATSGTM